MFTAPMVPLGVHSMGEHGPIRLYSHYGQILAQDGAQLRPATSAEIADYFRPLILGADGLREAFATAARVLTELAGVCDGDGARKWHQSGQVGPCPVRTQGGAPGAPEVAEAEEGVMQPGRKLDALVAETILGGVSAHPEWYWFRTSGRTLPDFTPVDGISNLYAGPHYSTDIEAAWLVAQKLGLALIPQSDGDGFRWLAVDCQSVRYYGGGIIIEPLAVGASCPEAAHAICLAALRAVGVEAPTDA